MSNPFSDEVFNDKKEKALFRHFWKLIISREFDEYTVYAFLILIRSIRIERPQAIRDYCDLIAHRCRNQGIAYAAINTAEANEYETYNGKVVGYQGISEEQWRDEWKKYAKTCGYELSDAHIRELILCIMSLSQHTTYEKINGSEYAEMSLYIGKNNKLALCTHKKDKAAEYVAFTVLENVKIVNADRYEKTWYQIEEAVEAIRENGILRLKAPSGYII